MIKLSRKQQLDMGTCVHFIPTNCHWDEITDEDIRKFFDWSDKGIGGDNIKQQAMSTHTGLSALYWGKQRRDLQVTSYLQDWGLITAADFVDEPEFLAIWLSKVMKKPGILTMWKLVNSPDKLDSADHARLEPFAAMGGW